MRPTALRRLLPLALVAACAPHAWADDPVPPPATPPGALVDPAWSGPPPGPEPAALPEPPPPAPEEAPAPPPPTAAAPARTDLSHLPPPVIRRAGQPRSAPLPTSPPPATYPPPSSFTPPPSTATPPPDSGPVAPLPATGPSFPAAAPQTPPSTGFASASILSVTKNHNMPLTDGTLALRLDTRYRVDDTVSRAYRVWITFFDRATGSAIRSTKPTFADAEGGLHVMTKPAHSTTAGQEFDAHLFVPYVVFPDPGPGQSTEIEARVELTRIEGGSQEVPVATSSTTFRVHGAPLEPTAAPPEVPPVTEFPAPR